jgi:hypothetical protein
MRSAHTSKPSSTETSKTVPKAVLRHFSDPITKKAVEEAGGGHAFSGSVAFSPEQLGALAHAYDFDLEADQDCPAAELMLAGTVRNLMRHAESDGMRLMAVLAKWLKKGQDPVKLLVFLADQSGLTVDPELAEWAREDCPYGKGV